jgi:hypothetical protein
LKAFPPFIDEGVHIQFVNDLAQVSPLQHITEGRQFTLWWYFWFRPDLGAGIWVIRTATILALLPGLAAGLALGKQYAGINGAILTGAALLFSTYHWFFDRLALADCVAGSAVLVALYFGARLRMRAHWLDAIAMGLALFLAIGLKLSTLPFVVLPILAGLVNWPTGRSWKLQARWVAYSLGTVGALLAAYALVARLARQNIFALLFVHNAAPTTESIFSKIGTHVAQSLSLLAAYIGPVGLLLAVAALVILVWKRQWYPLLCLFAPLLVLWINASQFSRFFYVPMALVQICIALAAGLLLRTFPRLIQTAGLVVLLSYGLLIAVPFLITGVTQPADLPLNSSDIQEYIRSDASGFALQETATTLTNLGATEAIGLLSNCYNMQLMLVDKVNLTCPQLTPSGSNLEALAQLLKDNQRQGMYVVLEPLPYTPATVPGQLIQTVARPAGGSVLYLYDLKP